ncbi:MAG TPA: class I SAM-dependent methyltransferase [Clostridiaceae bacterium]|nr:class I SAM-dependent methyltransferase [Clostridiaceae bacterium]
MQNNIFSYHILAKYYDEFQSYSDIESMQNEISESIAQYQQPEIADLGCGTGIFSLALVQQGYKVTALDLSEQMLRVLKAKKAQLPSSFQDNLRIIQADINEYVFPEKQDILLAMTDTLNHLDTEQFVNFFSVAGQNLINDGLLIFDLLKLEYLLGERANQTYFVEFDLPPSDSHYLRNNYGVVDSDELINFDDDIVSDKLFGEQNPAVSMIWENEWLENEQIAISNLTFFERVADSKQYLRFFDQIIEYYHDLENIEQIFCNKFTLKKSIDFPERRLFILQKISDCQ